MDFGLFMLLFVIAMSCSICIGYTLAQTFSRPKTTKCLRNHVAYGIPGQRHWAQSRSRMLGPLAEIRDED